MEGNSENKTLVLHIGTHKTGTTALQAMLILNQQVLARQGIVVPNTGRIHETEDYDTPGHHALAWEIMKPPPHELIARTIDELAASAARTAVISSEEFHPLHHRIDVMSALRAEFAEAGYRTVVLLYLRAQARYAESIFQQNIRDHRNPSFATFIEEILAHGRIEFENARFEFEYSRMLEALSLSFGAENIVVRPYLPDRGPEHLHQDFLRVVGMLHGSLAMDFKMTIANESYTLRELLKALHLNLRGETAIDDDDLLAFARATQDNLDERMLDHRFLLLQYAETLAFLQRFAPDNAVVAGRS
ncbi:MAG: hypothetical protein PXZ07_11170, partial [Candidatus Eremiobacteraeota bacterium]|nr:hypothetical protein [Candidatus Eremiobacteraeota bacterium]